MTLTPTTSIKKTSKIVIHFLFLITWQKFRIEREKLVTTNLCFNKRDSWVLETRETRETREMSRNAQGEFGWIAEPGWLLSLS